MINFDDYTNENKTKHNKKWSCIRDNPYRTLIGGSGSRKTNALLNLIENQLDIDKIYLFVKDPYQEKYQYFINIRESAGLNHFSDPKDFIEFSNDMQDEYSNHMQEAHKHTNEKRKILIVFDNMIADVINNKKLNSVVFLIYNKIMTINDQVKVEKLQYYINREASKKAALSSGKIDKYEYLTGKEILKSNQQQIIEQAKLCYSPLKKTFVKQIKTIEDQREKQIKQFKIKNDLKQSKNILMIMKILH